MFDRHGTASDALRPHEMPWTGGEEITQQYRVTNPEFGGLLVSEAFREGGDGIISCRCFVMIGEELLVGLKV